MFILKRDARCFDHDVLKFAKERSTGSTTLPITWHCASTGLLDTQALEAIELERKDENRQLLLSVGAHRTSNLLCSKEE
jgi:hypothetical protein